MNTILRVFYQKLNQRAKCNLKFQMCNYSIYVKKYTEKKGINLVHYIIIIKQLYINANQSFVQLFEYQFVLKLSTQFKYIDITTMNSYQFKQYIHNQNLFFQYNQIYLLQLKYDQFQMKQILLFYLPNIFRIIQYLQFYNLHFQI
ncbi:unnamed protein product [Paramecium primaurelia]|uniref:Uncharacterized protein n=1 Tax=Paramecium primaurelia TaxID=5886 RepID=A0A8S1JZ07_PARPR|nr:unnamed protein product [Paramecium primaurelia]